MLGLERVRPDKRAGRTLQPDQCGRVAQLRADQRGRGPMLGLERVRPDKRAGGTLQPGQCWRVAQLRADQRGRSPMLGLERGRPDGRAPEGRFSQVSAGSRHSCALSSKGTVECWGSNSSGQTNAPDRRFTNEDGDGQTSAPDRRFSQVSAGWLHSCALTSEGAVPMLGLERGRPDGRAGGTLQPGQRGRVAQLRADQRGRGPMLGLERARPDERAGRTLQPGQRGRGSQLRADQRGARSNAGAGTRKARRTRRRGASARSARAGCTAAR